MQGCFPRITNLQFLQRRGYTKAMNEVGYDAMAVGNHEFDFGLEIALGYKDQLNFPILSSNTYYKDGSGRVLIRIQS